MREQTREESIQQLDNKDRKTTCEIIGLFWDEQVRTQAITPRNRGFSEPILNFIRPIMQIPFQITPADWRRRAGRPRRTWLGTIELDLQPHNLGLNTVCAGSFKVASACGDRYAHSWTCYSMMMMMMMRFHRRVRTRTRYATIA